jgi:hypothetical protein
MDAGQPAMGNLASPQASPRLALVVAAEEDDVSMDGGQAVSPPAAAVLSPAVGEDQGDGAVSNDTNTTMPLTQIAILRANKRKATQDLQNAQQELQIAKRRRRQDMQTNRDQYRAQALAAFKAQQAQALAAFKAQQAQALAAFEAQQARQTQQDDAQDDDDNEKAFSMTDDDY